ncbi:MAG TPA: hypothetical protein VFS00_12850 [Polyangiaceae bacterium]|nr:hypothetical protein [Polyangiaceae bacterium]
MCAVQTTRVPRARSASSTRKSVSVVASAPASPWLKVDSGQCTCKTS